MANSTINSNPCFFFASTPHIHFGIGQRETLSKLVRRYGQCLLLITGNQSFDDSLRCTELFQHLSSEFDVHRVRVNGEPSPELVDHTVKAYFDLKPDCVVAIGGGSTVDAAKAIAGLLPSGDSVMEYLEGVGNGKVYQGISTPFIALPTTAGTGGETSKNAVLSEIGDNGFKKSFRDEGLVARHIILDPELTLSCSTKVTAACGMDAFTQLVESYVSRNASPLTDALALSGIEKSIHALPAVVEDGHNLAARSDMLYASSLSGLTLANAGLGSVHGLASPIGAYFPMPHGEVCGSLLYDACRINIEAMQAREPNNLNLRKYANIGRLMEGSQSLSDHSALDCLLKRLHQWTLDFNMPLLSDYGVVADDIPKLIDNASSGSMKTNPVTLSNDEIKALILARL